ncbi:PapD-like protein [Phyllosticta citricarpa]|uniref:PapD-like protein n=3 Tax=Phyllosticta TaxID=121621 RepID=A0ABR1MRG8_9PEZI
MSVELSPPELGFKRPFTTEVSQSLRLRNPNAEPVAFKVKTTAPKQYCVRPNSGRIEPGKEVEVQVLLQAMREDPPPDARCRDKFLVQSVAMTGDNELGNVASVWSHIEQTAKHTIQEKKIRVVFLPADGETSPAVNGTSTSNHDLSASQRSPSPEAVTPQRSVAPASGTVSRSESRPSDSKHVGEAVAATHNPAVSGKEESLRAELEQAYAKITRLEQERDQGLRQRKGNTVVSSGSDKGPTSQNMAMQHAPASGVSVQIAAGLCLFSFLLAYFFF